MSPETDDYTRINASSKIRFYLKYLNESDPVILCEAIRDLSFVPLPEAHQAIKKFLADQQDLGNTVLIQAATDALRTQERINGEER